MKIEMPVSELKKALPGLGRIIGRTSTLPVLRCVKVNCGANGSSIVEATNLDDFASVSISSKGDEGEVLVPFDHLSEITKACPTDQTIEIIRSKKDILLRYPIAGNRVERPVEILELKEWPQSPSVAGAGINVTQELKTALQEAFACASSDASRYVLQGAFLDVRDPKAHYVVGTNGRILFSANSFNFDLKQSLIVPDRKFLHWKEFLDDGDWQLSVQPAEANKGGWLQLKSNRWTFVTKQVEGEYPNWKQVVPSDTPKTVVGFSDEAVQFLLKAIPKLPSDPKDINEGIRFVVNESVLVQARGSNAENWTTLPVVGATSDGAPTTFGMNRNFAFQALECGLNELELRQDAHAVFRKGGKRLVVALLRMEQPTPEPASTSPSRNPQPTKERTSMAKETVEAPKDATDSKEKSSFAQLQEQVAAIKETLKGVVAQLNDTLRIVGQAYREKRATEKEIDSIRDSLREIQQMKI